ncbi:MAG: fasciclin domain-containing protein [Bacteroidales bacterium]|nr:fasciclin domain-containing protein [Bacteroidales bacterium]
MKTISNIFRKSSLVALVAVAFFAASCENEEMPKQMNASQELMTIPETLGAISENPEILAGYETNLKNGRGDVQRFNSQFKTLRAALDYTGLSEVVSENRFTVLAPTDEAFENLFNTLGIDGIYDLSAQDLTPILLYHVFTGLVYSGDLTNGYATTANGASVKVMVNGSVMFNDATVLAADIKAMNGVIHAIDKVLLPPTLVDLALGNPDFSILVQAVVKAGLVETLATGGPFTVFAPTNDAFAALLDELGPTVNSLDDIPVDLLTSVLLYHVVPGAVYSTDLPAGDLSVATVQGESFTINKSMLKITDVNMREAGLVAVDIAATNGVIHVINKVILPTLP